MKGKHIVRIYPFSITAPPNSHQAKHKTRKREIESTIFTRIGCNPSAPFLDIQSIVRIRSYHISTNLTHWGPLSLNSQRSNPHPQLLPPQGRNTAPQSPPAVRRRVGRRSLRRKRRIQRRIEQWMMAMVVGPLLPLRNCWNLEALREIPIFPISKVKREKFPYF